MDRWFLRRGAAWCLLAAVALLGSVLAMVNAGGKMLDENHARIVDFAIAFSGDDAALVEQVRRMAANPPTDLKTIGFYGAQNNPPRHRLFLATVSLLDNAGKLSSVEDKYTAEIFATWAASGVIDASTLSPVAKAVFGPLIDARLGTGEDVVDPVYRDMVWSRYAQATEELERHVAERGRVLLSVDATGGDTMFFAVVTPEIAERWRDRALSEHEGYRSGVRSPMWDRFWNHLCYSVGEAIEDRSRKGYPPGTRRRVETISFIE
jgi:hypothetical protein